jgi:hypothetical protein
VFELRYERIGRRQRRRFHDGFLGRGHAASRRYGRGRRQHDGPFCSGPPAATAFCASFDEGHPAAFDWDGPEMGGDVSLDVAQGAAGIPSPPGALRATVAATSECLGQAQLVKTLALPASFTKVHAEFMTKVDNIGARFSYVRLLAKPTPDSNSAWQLGLSHADSKSDYSESWTQQNGETSSLGQGNAFLRYLQLGVWTKVAIDITFAPPRFDVSFDDVRVASHDSAVVAQDLTP